MLKVLDAMDPDQIGGPKKPGRRGTAVLFLHSCLCDQIEYMLLQLAIDAIVFPDVQHRLGSSPYPQQQADIVFLTIDLTPQMLLEAGPAARDHLLPTIFRAKLNLSTDGDAESIKEEAIMKLIARGTSLYCPHTSLNAAQAGALDDWLAKGIEQFGIRSTAPITPSNVANPGSEGSAIKKHLNLPFVRVATAPRSHKITSIAGARLGCKIHKVVKKIAAKYGPIVRARLPGVPYDTVFVADADMVAEVHRAEGPIPKRTNAPTWEYYRKKNNVPMGLVLEDGDEWKRLRSAVQTPIFPPKNARAYCSVVGPATAQVMNVIEDGLRRAGPRSLAGEELFAMEEITMRWSLEAVTTIILGQRLGALDAEPNPLALEMIRAANAMIKTTGPVLLSPSFVWRYGLTKPAREHFKAMQTIMDLTNKLLDTTLDELAKDPAKLQGSFLGQILQRDVTITRRDLLSTAVDLLVAGIDTTSRSLLSTMNLLGRYPDVQGKLRDEFYAVVGTDPNAQLDASHLAKFKYLKNVLKEATRIFMVVPINTRFLARDAIVGGYAIPQGTVMLLASETIAHSPKYFANPETFNPDRWDAKDIHPFASLPFGFGRFEPKDTGKQFHLVVKKLAAKYGPIMRLRMPGYDRDAVLVTDPDMVADVHRNEGPFPKRLGVLTWLHMREKRQVPLRVVFENGPEWKKLRLAIQAPISQHKNVSAHCPARTLQAMTNLVQQLHEAGPQTLADKNPFVMEDLVMR
ncbi:hypothetical protein GGF31_002618 [Allomyces arbusculus]|nr:hypothetical protein GGF31_002618 [Allomyces arbusculus]